MSPRRRASVTKYNHSKKGRATKRRWDTYIKRLVLTHYGKDGKPMCCWRGCRITNLDMLTLDHKNNDGGIKRDKGEQPFGKAIYSWVKNHLFPKEFQTLCWNHQWVKRMNKLRKLHANA